MDINVPQLTAIIIYLIRMMIIGVYATKKTNDLSDYVLGGRQLTGEVSCTKCRCL